MVCKRAVSVSLGAASRDVRHEITWGEEQLVFQRIGTDGNLKSASYLLRHFDGNADAIGLGGINLAYRSGSYSYPLPEAQWLASLVRYTPVVDGSGVKRYWEAALCGLLAQTEGWQWDQQRVLVLSALDRWDLAQTLQESGAQLRIADPLLALGLPLFFRSVQRFQLVARLTLPFLSLIPIRAVYPHHKTSARRRLQGMIDALRDWATCIVGDHRFLACLSPCFGGQHIITSGIGQAQAQTLMAQGAQTVVSMNYLEHRGPLAANLAEAALVAASGRSMADLSLTSLRQHTSQLGLGAMVWHGGAESLHARFLS